MKKFISLIAIVLSVVCISVCGFAETQTVGLNLGTVGTYYWPCTGSAVGLIDLNQDFVRMAGFETNFGKIQEVIDVNLGGITSEIGNGTPYVSLSYTIAELSPEGVLEKIGFEDVSLGGFAGYDFTIKDPVFVKNWRIGLALSTEIFGAIK
jgi:hypothetical protein